MDSGAIQKLVEGGFELRETHISWVLLDKLNAYKIKKPVKFSFLDFSTLERREFFCEEEVRLNRRLSPEVYLGVAPITQDENGITFEGTGKTIEHSVKMRRLDELQKMDVLLKEHKVNETDISELAEVVAEFHKNAEVVSGEFNSPSLISAQVADLGSFRKEIDRATGLGPWVDNILSRSSSFIKRNEKMLLKRIRDGFVRDCHGDLHSGNVFFQDGIKIIDCIEFSKDFRCIDVASDVAFMAMDLEYNGKHDLADLFVEKYLSKTGYELEPLLVLYKCYRANVRAKIAAIDWMQKPSREAVERMDRYVLLAERYSKMLN